MAQPLSVLDFAVVRPRTSVGQALAESVELAQAAERLDYTRVWYTEHHNMATIASAAPAVLIAHIATQTNHIRLGSGGVMLPNHSPLVIAEQFGTLAELHPGRIDLGLGRAPGTDRAALRAMRRDLGASDRFPDDVVELRTYLSDEPRPGGIKAIPGAGTKVPLYILGSSLFGAQLAAALGLPYAFASHFAPDALEVATNVYRARFEPSDQLAEPYVIAAVNVIARSDAGVAADELEWARRDRVARMLGRGRQFSADEIDELMTTPEAAGVLHMMQYTAAGDADDVRDYLTDFADLANADELIVAPIGSTPAGAIESLEVTR